MSGTPRPSAADEEEDEGRHEAVAFIRGKRWQGPGELPAARYRAAQRARQAPHDTVALGTWQPLGPANVGARTKALVFDPSNANILYAVTSLGGVWKTTDAGQNWTPLTDSLPTLAMNTLAIHPSDPNTLYAGSGEVIPGAGIFKTSDGGQTWTQLAGTTNFANVYSLAISPGQPATIYAGTDSGLWYSLDAGATWTNSLQAAGGCYSVAVSGRQPTDVVFASCSQSGGNPFAYFHTENEIPTPSVYAVYRTEDATSSNWEIVVSDPNMGPAVLAVAPSAPNTVYALALNIDPSSPFFEALLGLYASDAAGASGTWQERADVSDPNSMTSNILSYRAQSAPCTYGPGGAGLHGGQGAWNLSLAVDPTDSQTLFTAGYFISRSQDGGRTFAAVATTANLLSHVDHHGFAFPPGYNARTNQTLFAINDGGVYRTDIARTQSEFTLCSQPFYLLTGGATNNGLQINQFYGGSVTAGGGVYIGGTQDTVTLMASAANPSTWTPVLNGDGGLTAFDPLDANTIYYEYQHRGFSKSTDGGSSAGPATNGITDDASAFPFLTIFALDPTNSRTLYLGVNRLWRSVDGAQSWLSASPDTGANVTAITVNPANTGQVLYGDVTGAIYNGTPGTAGSDGTWSSSQPRAGYVSHFAFDPTQAGLVYATYATFRQQAADSQVYVSADGGSTWQALGGTSLPDIPVHTLVIDPDASSTLYIGTDIGVLVSFDSGKTWAPDTSFLSVVVETLQIDKNGAAKYLYAFTFGRGLWRVNLTPGVAECAYTVSPSSFNIDGNSGQVYAVSVDTTPGCAWAATAVQSPPFNVRIQSPASGNGPGTLYFTASANYSGAARTLQFSVQDQVISIQQSAASAAGTGFDELPGASVILSLPYLRTGRYTTLTANRTDPVHSCTGSADVSTVWFAYRATANQRIDVTQSTGGSAAVVAVYAVQNGAVRGEIGCATNSGNVSQNPSVQFDAVAGNSYVIELAGVGAALFTVTLNVQVLPTITITAGSTTLAPGESMQFAASVAGTPNTAVRWSAVYGTIDANGNYMAPAKLDAGTALVDTITATSFADSNATATASVTVQM
ncbi:MAG TPA: hypothetical protein VKU19_28650 [Bryobacteraceae bacterium]|nr:hypothetical protein [Bryobacteraceae bacterium]